MKAGIHPAYNELNVICACGNTFKTVPPTRAISGWKSARRATRSSRAARSLWTPLAAWTVSRGSTPPAASPRRPCSTNSAPASKTATLKVAARGQAYRRCRHCVQRCCSASSFLPARRRSRSARIFSYSARCGFAQHGQDLLVLRVLDDLQLRLLPLVQISGSAGAFRP